MRFAAYRTIEELRSSGFIVQKADSYFFISFHAAVYRFLPVSGDPGSYQPNRASLAGFITEYQKSPVMAVFRNLSYH